MVRRRPRQEVDVPQRLHGACHHQAGRPRGPGPHQDLRRLRARWQDPQLPAGEHRRVRPLSADIRGGEGLDRGYHRGEVLPGAARSSPGLRREDRGASRGEDHHRIGGAGKGADGEERVKGSPSSQSF